MFSLAIGPDEIETVLNKILTALTDSIFCRISLEDGNHFAFILKNKYLLVPDIDLKGVLSCDPSKEKLVFSNLWIKSYSADEEGPFHSITKKVLLDSFLSSPLTKEILLSFASWRWESIIWKESDDTFSLSFRHLADVTRKQRGGWQIMKKLRSIWQRSIFRRKKGETASQEAEENVEKNRYLSFLARIRFHALFVRDNRLVLQAGLDD